jgi:hypothetical protein
VPLPERLHGVPLLPRVLLLVLLQAGLAVVLYRWRVDWASTLIPLMQWALVLCESRFDVTEFSVVLQGAEQRFFLRLLADRPVLVMGQVLPGMDVSATTLVTHLVQTGWILGAVLISGWLLVPLRVVRLLLSGTVAFCLLCWLDIPLTLLGSIEGLLAQNFAPATLTSNPWVRWEQFLTQGGRMALALGLGLLALMLSLQPVLPSPHTNASSTARA